jgi:antitoxin component of MazEF toxin-antitoxin module
MCLLIKVDIPQGTITTLTKAHSKSNSLRTTIPISIINQFGFKEGDRLIWKMEIENNSLIIKIKPVE